MSSPFVGEIRPAGFNFNPAGWLFCDGSLVPISQFDTVFNLIGTTYGGDGQSTFALPDLRGRVPVHMGTGGGGTYTIGQTGGVESVTLTVSQIPAHNHPMVGTSNAGVSNNVANSVPGNGQPVYSSSAPTVNLDYVSPGGPAMIHPAGGNQPHDNMQPYLVLNFIISMFGIFPSQT